MLNLKDLILTTGYLGIFSIIFAESGLLIGFLFPGDSLLITAGLLASQGHLDIKILISIAIAGAILGDTVGYWFGNKTGPKIFKRDNSLIFHKKNLLKANEFYQRHGGKTIVMARFLPFIRTFAPIVAGVGKMKYGRFLSFNVFGGIFWVLLTCLLGYFLGNTIPDIDRYIIVIILLIVFLSALPGLIHFWKDYRQPFWQILKRKIGF